MVEAARLQGLLQELYRDAGARLLAMSSGARLASDSTFYQELGVREGIWRLCLSCGWEPTAVLGPLPSDFWAQAGEKEDC